MVRILLCASVLLWGAVGRAGEAPVEIAPAQPSAVELLEKVPNYMEILADQWTSGVPTDTEDRHGEHYGLLIDRGPERPITLQECVALALQNNTGLRVDRLDPISATAAVRSAWSQFDPKFFGEHGKNRNTTPVATISAFTSGISPEIFNQDVVWDFGLRKTLLSGGVLTAEFTNERLSSTPNVVNLLVPQYRTGLGVSLAQPLLRDFGWRFALLVVDVAQNEGEQSYYLYRAQVETLVARVEELYWILDLAIENVRVEEQGLELAGELLREAEGRFKVGALPRTAVLEAKAEAARREANLVDARNRRRIARDNLRALVNAKQPSDDALLMIEPSDQPSVMPYDIDLERSLATGFARRPELIAARLEVDAKKLEGKIAENQLLPRVDLVASFGLRGLGGSDVFDPDNPLPGEFRANPQVLGGYSRSLEFLTDGRFYEYGIGATVEVPIANAAAKAEYAQAKIETERARLVLQQLEENVTLEITQAVGNLKALTEGVRATRIARELAQENVHDQRARYDVGLATTKDLIDFGDRLTQAQREEIRSLTLYNTELARLHRAEGMLLEDRDIVLRGPELNPAPWWARF